ncbi:MAG: hypothetical protein BWY73_01180 [candidate division TA06 bacterium ADurb.Bin417]|uniref:Uncharacterized protein n=1 Tax=candidate division TA06 bacterium ADurb.Bin417 TaxID=1852828 RepID=A0A1V5MD13_UNCT6|nr:MAG: hypothetical protein BWY73_01180 [candidate division TA06 bacterium ADurb.Bin417]
MPGPPHPLRAGVHRLHPALAAGLQAVHRPLPDDRFRHPAPGRTRRHRPPERLVRRHHLLLQRTPAGLRNLSGPGLRRAAPAPAGDLGGTSDGRPPLRPGPLAADPGAHGHRRPRAAARAGQRPGPRKFHQKAPGTLRLFAGRPGFQPDVPGPAGGARFLPGGLPEDGRRTRAEGFSDLAGRRQPGHLPLRKVRRRTGGCPGGLGRLHQIHSRRGPRSQPGRRFPAHPLALPLRPGQVPAPHETAAAGYRRGHSQDRPPAGNEPGRIRGARTEGRPEPALPAETRLVAGDQRPPRAGRGHETPLCPLRLLRRRRGHQPGRLLPGAGHGRRQGHRGRPEETRPGRPLRFLGTGPGPAGGQRDRPPGGALAPGG